MVTMAEESVDALIDELTAERDSWRRVAERLEGEKIALQKEVERLKATSTDTWERDRIREIEQKAALAESLDPNKNSPGECGD